MRVLLVDDESDFLEQAKIFLEKKQREFEVDTSTSVGKALGRLEKDGYDTIVSDYKMPEKDGLEFLEEIRRRNIDIPFIIFTGKGREEVAMEALNLGADRYLQKGGDPRTQYDVLSEAIQREVKHKKQRNYLLENKEISSTLFEHIPISYVRVDEDGNIVDHEINFDELEKPEIGNVMFKEYEKSWCSEVYPDMMDVIEGEGIVEEYERRLDDKYLAVRILPFLDGAIIVYEDVTKYRERIEELDKRLNSFLQAISHEIKAPLRSVLRTCEICFEEYDEIEEDVKDHLSRIKNAAESMDLMVRDIISYEKLISKKEELKPISLDSVLEESMDILDDEIENKEAELSIEEDLPEVLGHYPTLVQIFTNLISNGLKFVEEGRRPSVDIYCEEEDTIRVWVEDNGIGICPEYHESIYKPFERLHGVERYRGTGLGLTIVRRGIEMMGGDYGVQSEEGKGSRFWVELSKP